jgi:hypothetical protein
MYDVQCDILSKGNAGHMNARAALSNGREVKENGGGTVVLRATEDNFEVALEI